INPGPIDTGWMDDEVREACAAQTPGGELGGPETVADLARFLLSTQGAWIRGQLLLSNGGFATPAGGGAGPAGGALDSPFRGSQAPPARAGASCPARSGTLPAPH